MSLFVDPRAGSRELIAPLQKMGLPAEATTLEFGDLAFVSRDKRPIGIEFKSLSDVISSLRNGRLVGHQLPGMLGPKGFYEVAWLLIEGEWKPGDDGYICVPKWRRRHQLWEPMPGGMSADEYDKRLNTLTEKHGLNVWPTQNRAQTLSWIRAKYRWWTDSTMADHDSGTALYQRPMGIGFAAIDEHRAVFARLPGVGLKWSKVAAERFGNSLLRASHASAEEWANLELGGKHFGLKTAQRVVAFLRGE